MTAPERRRLELVRTPRPTPPFARRVVANVRAIGIADGEPGAGALDWAVELAIALAVRVPVTFVACAFGRTPAIDGALGERLTAAGVVALARSVAEEERGFDAIFAELPAQPAVFVGEPALALLEPELGVLVAGPGGLRALPPALLAHASRAHLWLESPRSGVARALAAQF